ncbi:MAG: hypothetical protein H6709_22995 [Kofleriaceae bacterium]|nr:hypothetical protein [Myxococcales bacterium]MCB9563539.1 hypothetical protein [Kofleriaceae bacterium]MCB9574951.1 hypothetical protein [Kofleriaceae bacterium]
MSGYQHAPATRRVLDSLVPVVCPPEAVELGLVADIVDHVGLTMGALPGRFRGGLIMGLRTYDLGALIWPPGRLRPAHRLAPALAARYFDTWLHGPTPIHKQLALGIRQLIALAHYEQPVIQERMGYRPAQWIEQVKRRRLELYADDIERHARSLIEPDPLPGIAPHPRARTRTKGVA